MYVLKDNFMIEVEQATVAPFEADQRGSAPNGIGVRSEQRTLTGAHVDDVLAGVDTEATAIHV